MSLDAAEVFVRVVQAGSFSGAARVLGMPRSTVSLRIAELEERLGVNLLKRTTRSVHLTETGAAYFETAARALSDLRSAEEELTGARDTLKGTLRISSTAAMTGGAIGDVITSFMAEHPEVSIDLQLSHDRVDLLAENFDIAIRFGKLEDLSGLVARKLGASYLKMLASPSYLARHPTPRHPRDLHGPELLRFAGLDVLELHNDRGERFRLPLSGRFCSNQLSPLRHQAVAGVGIAPLPVEFVADDLRRGTLVPVLPEWRSKASPIHVVYPRQKFVPKRVRVFVDFIVRELPADAFTEARRSHLPPLAG